MAMTDRDRNILAFQISQKNPELGAYLKTLPLDHPDLDGAKKYRESFGSRGFREYKEKIEFNKTLEEVRAKREFQRPLEEKWAQEAEARKLQDDYKPAPKTESDIIPISTDKKIDPEKVISKRKKAGYTKIKPVKLTDREIQAIKDYTGIRRDILLPPGTLQKDAKNIMQAMGGWNTYIKTFASELERADPSFFNNPDGTPILTDIMDQRTRRKRELVTKKDKWISDRTLDYGHLGGASSPQFGWMSKWIQNAQPEFSWDNQLSGATMTPTEFVSVMDRTSNLKPQQKGSMSINSATKDQIKKYSQELKEIRSANAGRMGKIPLDPKAYDSLMSLPSVQTPEDIVRQNISPDNSEYFVLDKNNRIPSEVNKDMLTVMQDNPSVDFNATAVLGDYPEEMINQVRAKPADGRYMSAFREAVDRIAEYGEPQKLQKLLQIAKEAAGKGVWGVAPVALMMADPEINKTIDELGIERGSDAWVGLFESVGIEDAASYVGDSWNNAMSAAKSGQYGTSNQVQAGILDFVADVGKAVVTETPGYIASMNDWIKSNNQAMESARAEAGVTSAADVARQRYLALQDEGLLKDIWFGNPHND